MIAVVDPALVIAIGASALAALSRIERHDLALRVDLERCLQSSILQERTARFQRGKLRD